MRIKTDSGYDNIKTVELVEDDGYKLKLIDQRLLPHKLKFVITKSVNEAIHWITDMVVRGAPAIGATGAYALVLGIQEGNKISRDELDELAAKIIKARPTAKDLSTFVQRMVKFITSMADLELADIADYSRKLAARSEKECKMIGEQSKHLINNHMGVLTHCNAGSLATVDWGTALSPMRLAHYDGIEFKVFVDETRPRLQGMLTAWELLNEGIDHEVIVDNAAGFFMQQGKIDLVITGTDRVLKDGTVTNKIGTFEKAVVAKQFDIPFYIAMPWTTFDPEISNADEIPIEFRSANEISHIRTKNRPEIIAPESSTFTNPAFDITPAEFITGYITQNGILKKEQLEEYYNKYMNTNYH